MRYFLWLDGVIVRLESVTDGLFTVLSGALGVFTLELAIEVGQIFEAHLLGDFEY